MRATKISVEKMIKPYLVTIDNKSYVTQVDKVKREIVLSFDNIGCVIEEINFNGKTLRKLVVKSALSSRKFAEYFIFE